MKKIWYWSTALVCLAAVVALGWTSLKSKKPPPKEEVIKEFAASDFVYPLEQELRNAVTLTGRVFAPDAVQIRAKSAGTLLSLSVREGDTVGTGQVLGQLDVSDLNVRLAERGAQLEAAKTTLLQHQAQHASNQSLVEQGFLSVTAIKASSAALENAKAQVKSAQAQAVAARKQLSESQILAPIAGVVSKRAAMAGEKLAQEQEILTLQNMERLEFRTLLDPALASHLKPGQQFELALDGTSQKITANLQRIGPWADTESRLLPLVLAIKNPVQALWPGLLGHTVLSYPLLQRGLTLPIAAVQEEGGKNVVWALVNQQLVRKTVLLSAREPGSQWGRVLEGISATDQVLALRFEGLKDGMKILVKPAANPVKPAGTVVPVAPVALKGSGS